MSAFAHTISHNLKEHFTPKKTASSFREDGQITIQEFYEAADHFVDKMKLWSWSDADKPSVRAVHRKEDSRQYLVYRGAKCSERLRDTAQRAEKFEDENFATDEPENKKSEGAEQDADANWVLAGEDSSRDRKNVEEDIPDIDDEEDDDAAIIKQDEISEEDRSLRRYNVYICYSNADWVPYMFLSGYSSRGDPLTPDEMLEDVSGDHALKTASVESFPHFESSVKMICIHACKHAEVMKKLLEKYELGVQYYAERQRERAVARGFSGFENVPSGMEGLDDLLKDAAVAKLSADRIHRGQEVSFKKDDADAGDWDMVKADEIGRKEHLIEMKHYLIIFLKLAASIVPNITYDDKMTMAIQ